MKKIFGNMYLIIIMLFLVSADSNAHIPIVQRESFDVGIYEIFA